MKWPSEKELSKMRRYLEEVDPARSLPENPSKAEFLKYKLCEEFVKYLLKTGQTQKELSIELGIDPARINDIVKYKIDLFTVDRLISFTELLYPDLKIQVASA